MDEAASHSRQVMSIKACLTIFAVQCQHIRAALPSPRQQIAIISISLALAALQHLATL